MPARTQCHSFDYNRQTSSEGYANTQIHDDTTSHRHISASLWIHLPFHRKPKYVSEDAAFIQLIIIDKWRITTTFTGIPGLPSKRQSISHLLLDHLLWVPLTESSRRRLPLVKWCNTAMTQLPLIYNDELQYNYGATFKTSNWCKIWIIFDFYVPLCF